MTEPVKSAVCESCNPRCRILVHSRDGELTKMEEDKPHPRTSTTWPPTEACPRFRGAKEFMYQPARLKFPLQRAGGKGEGKRRQISWEERHSMGSPEDWTRSGENTVLRHWPAAAALLGRRNGSIPGL